MANHDNQNVKNVSFLLIEIYVHICAVLMYVYN
jgi:hypothetical protein